MISRTALIGMLKTDALRLLRDRFLIGISLYILFIFVAMRAFIPWLTAEIASNGGFDLIPYLPLIVSYIVVQIAPMLPGIIGGFMLLESREEGTAKALLVTPSSYLPVMCVAMIVISVALTVFAGAIIEIAMPSWSAQIAIAFVAAPSAPIFALALATLANNKVQAFAWMKALGIGPLLVVGAWFLPEACSGSRESIPRIGPLRHSGWPNPAAHGRCGRSGGWSPPRSGLKSCVACSLKPRQDSSCPKKRELV
jgi:fluoroquinolone transport system permease protein